MSGLGLMLVIGCVCWFVLGTWRRDALAVIVAVLVWAAGWAVVWPSISDQDDADALAVLYVLVILPPWMLAAGAGVVLGRRRDRRQR
jgi:hypothetical protein